MQIGDYSVQIIQDAEFRLDGGAMFGVVPRKLWSQVCPPDDENRIRMNMNCVFIDAGSEKVLDRKSTRLNSSHHVVSRMPSSA